MAGLIEWDDLHQSLREKIKTLHPVSESLGVVEKTPIHADEDVSQLILDELKAIRKALEKRTEE